MHQQSEAESNTRKLTKYFQDLLDQEGEKGDIGVTSFRSVFDVLIDVQKEKLRQTAGERFDSLYDSGAIICMGVAYKDPVIDWIDEKKKGTPDYKLWNEYAKEYHRINQVLNRMAVSIASRFDGTPLKATIGGEIGYINHVHEYFPMVVSHRVVAEKSGLGWRGKNQLVIHEKFSCAIRFSSVLVNLPLILGEGMESKCGDCTACEDVCGYIRHRDKLPDYRENCRKYILFLKSNGIEKDICGKCIKACYRSSFFSEHFSLE
jgi:epoxyqueuosine reductase QueG